MLEERVYAGHKAVFVCEYYGDGVWALEMFGDEVNTYTLADMVDCNDEDSIPITARRYTRVDWTFTIPGKS